jgi:arsenate reductase
VKAGETVSIYGIKACDTMKRARGWLDAAGIAYAFHDYKTLGIDAGTLTAWAEIAGWEKLLNRAGTTFRKIPDSDKTGIDQAKAIGLMMSQPSMIKRPVLSVGGRLIVGFNPDIYRREFSAS